MYIFFSSCTVRILIVNIIQVILVPLLKLLQILRGKQERKYGRMVHFKHLSTLTLAM